MKNTNLHVAGSEPIVVVTGGAGFIGTNVSDRLLRDGYRVRVLDNLSREGVSHNVDWLRTEHGASATLEVADVRNPVAVRNVIDGAAAVFHFAAQVAVTTSLVAPVEDFEVNALGTINVLEAVRRQKNPPFVMFTSTNKVYGDLADVPLTLSGCRYQPEDQHIRDNGVSETRPLDFHSPYGCSKGTADQYVLDYGRSYDIPTAVFRMSCIYGPHQFGNEDQGWVAHFLIKALRGEPITLYGDGKQVRDILFVEDLVEAMMRTWKKSDETARHAFNMGGGPANTISLLELLDLIGERTGDIPTVVYDDWRTGDQRYYVSDTGKAQRALGWKPKVGVAAGVNRLADWLLEESPLLRNKKRRTDAIGAQASVL